jgi:predicted short-subunit dehydrogenase-like oxidoreductase (DUF2520 family)
LHIMEDLGETQEDAFDAFLPLMVGALQNVETLGVGEALTGPIARGDVATIERHLDALQLMRPEIREIYKCLGAEAVDISVRSGKISKDRAQKLKKLLTSTAETIH